MSMALLFPAALAALTALIVPLILHIARRSEAVPTDFAALRWLRQKPRPRSRLRFDEWPLLLIRLLLLALAALWLAQPVLFGAADRSPYVAVVPGTTFDAAVYKDSRLHWLAPGFPAIDQPKPAGPIPLASLIRQIDAELPTDAPLTILVPPIVEGTDGDRLHLSRKVTWRITGGVMASATRPLPPPPLSIRYDADHRAALRYIRAAALASAKRDSELDSFTLDKPLPDKDHVLVWLAAGTLLDKAVKWVRDGGTLIVASDVLLPTDRAMVPVWRDAQGEPLAEARSLGHGRLIRFTRPLMPSHMPQLLEADFPAQLQALSRESAAPTRVTAADYAPLTGGRAYDQPPQSLRSWLALLIALLLLVERWIATRRSRSIAP
jgi:hypothetical protein